MIMRKVNFSKQAEKILDKLHVSNRKQAILIVKEVQSLASNPLPKNCKKLKGYKYYRVRVGNYRIIYHFSDEVLFVTIINKRDVVYKHL